MKTAKDRPQKSWTMHSRFYCCVFLIVFASPAFSQSVLLIPDGIDRRIAAFSPEDGSVIDLNFVPPDPVNMMSPFNAVASGRGTIFVSDVQADAIFEYTLGGSFVGTFADSSDGLDEVIGITVFDNSLYAAVCGNAGGLGDTIQQFDIASGSQTTWTGDETNGPYDVLFLTSSPNVLVSNINTNDIERYDLSGDFNGTFHESNGVDGIDFPEQLHETSSGEILTAGFFEPRGIYRYDTSGIQLDYHDVGSSVRGVFELGNGNILWTNNSAVFSLNPITGVSTLITGDGNFRYIEQVELPLLGDVNLDGIVDLLDVLPFVDLLANQNFQIEADLNLDGVVDLLDVQPFVLILSGG